MNARIVRIVLLVGLLGGAVSWTLIAATPALAHCHHFTVTASPTAVAQGGRVTVTVSRDGNAAPSGVHVSTVDGSAHAPADYSKLDQNVEFTSETSRTFTVATARDPKSDPAETFRLHLSDPSGCAPNPYYVVDPDVTVTINANSVATPKPTARPTAKPVVRPATSAAPKPSASPSPTPSPSPTLAPSASPTLAPQATSPKKSNRTAIAIAGIVAGAVAVVSGVALFVYRRRMI